MITQSELKDIIWYNQDTGIFTWKIVSNHRFKAGSIAGNINKYGYINIGYRRTYYKAHKLAWLYVYGFLPEVLDHINGNKIDNRIENLRIVSKRQNSQNAKCHRNGKLIGACKTGKGRPWRSQIYVNGKTKSLGVFDTELEAAEAYANAIHAIGERLITETLELSRNVKDEREEQEA